MQNINLIKKYIKNKRYGDAEKIINKLMLEDKNNYQYYLLLGYIHIKNNNINDAIKNYQHAKKLNLNDTVLNTLSKLYVRVNNYDQALTELSESLKINNKNPITMNNYGCLLISKKRESESIKYFQNSIKLDSNYMDPKYNLLEILDKTSNIKLFEETIKKERKNFPHDSILKYFNGVYLSLIKNWNDAYKILESISFKKHNQNWEYKRLNLIGSIYHEIKNYKQSFINHSNANNFLINNYCLDTFKNNSYYNKLKKFLTFVENNKEKKIKKNNQKSSMIFIVGFPRSGTTLLDTILSSHSKIKVLEEKPLIQNTINEISDSEKINCKNIDNKLQKKYLSYLSKYIDTKSISNKIIIDKMPLNLVYARLINKIFPDAIIIFCLRHPLDTILSCYFQNFILNEAMVNFLDLNRTAKIFNLTMELFNSYKEIPSDKILNLKYENIVTNFDHELELVCKFIGIKKELSMKEFYKFNTNNERVVRTASYNQVNKPIYTSSKFKWLNYKDELKPVIPIVEKWINYYKY